MSSMKTPFPQLALFRQFACESTVPPSFLLPSLLLLFYPPFSNSRKLARSSASVLSSWNTSTSGTNMANGSCRTQYRPGLVDKAASARPFPRLFSFRHLRLLLVSRPLLFRSRSPRAYRAVEEIYQRNLRSPLRRSLSECWVTRVMTAGETVGCSASSRYAIYGKAK